MYFPTHPDVFRNITVCNLPKQRNCIGLRVSKPDTSQDGLGYCVSRWNDMQTSTLTSTSTSTSTSVTRGGIPI